MFLRCGIQGVVDGKGLLESLRGGDGCVQGVAVPLFLGEGEPVRGNVKEDACSSPEDVCGGTSEVEFVSELDGDHEVVERPRTALAFRVEKHLLGYVRIPFHRVSC